MAAVSSVARAVSSDPKSVKDKYRTSISFGTIVLDVSEDGVSLVRVEGRNAVMGDVFHPKGRPSDRGRSQQESEHALHLDDGGAMLEVGGKKVLVDLP